jgi:MutS domain V
MKVLGDAREEYSTRLEARRAALAMREQRHFALGNLRVLVFLGAVAMAFAAFDRGALSKWWLLVPTALFFWLGARLGRLEAQRAALSRAIAFYSRGLARLDGRWAGSGETGARFLDEHHLYARDLDIFGEASLFELLCYARTRIGEERLATWLQEPAPPDAVKARQTAVLELATRVDLREDLAVLGEKARAGVQTEVLAAWGERHPLLEFSPFRPVAWGLSLVGALAVAALVTYLAAGLGIFELAESTMAGLRVSFLLAALIFGGVLWRFKNLTDQIIQEVEQAAHDLSLFAGVLHRLEDERFVSPRLATLRAELDIQGRPPSRRIARLNWLMALVDSRHHLIVRLFGPLVLWDLHLCFSLEDWRRTSGPDIRRWLNAVGEIEALSSLAAYSYEHPRDVFPDVTAESPCFEGEALGHPLLAEDRMVPNDVRIAGDLRVLVVSGSNMSGKSTLLRTIGVNAVLAQAGAPVRARRLRVSPLAIGASIRIQDSLQEGTSRFYAEITRLRQIMETAAVGPPVLFLIDEFLHGTNSHDRRIGAEAIVRGLVDRGAIGLVTTHDLALAHIATALGPRGANVHFEDYLEDGHVRFDYRMRPGVVQKSNAIELMRSVGLEV